VQAIYKGISQEGVREHAKVNPSPEAYANLIEGRTDILFALQPSPEQIAAAKAKGVFLQLTPLGREAFVFFVNAANPVDNLSSEQLRAIYTKRITNWKEVGGKDVRILPFQRRKNSGSQTAMELQVMRGEKMAVPLWDEYALDMFGIVRRTADYRNADTALGYSFRFFALETGEKNIKLLKIDGIAPTLESIRDESYPYTSTAYAVTTDVSAQKPHVRELIEWFVGAQGQKLISDSGYAPLK
jgi:phosphate transport system substrate-binding protein